MLTDMVVLLNGMQNKVLLQIQLSPETLHLMVVQSMWEVTQAISILPTQALVITMQLLTVVPSALKHLPLPLMHPISTIMTLIKVEQYM